MKIGVQGHNLSGGKTTTMTTTTTTKTSKWCSCSMTTRTTTRRRTTYHEWKDAKDDGAMKANMESREVAEDFLLERPWDELRSALNPMARLEELEKENKFLWAQTKRLEQQQTTLVKLLEKATKACWKGALWTFREETEEGCAPLPRKNDAGTKQLASIQSDRPELAAAKERVLNEELTELRGWDSTKVTWTIRDLESRLTHLEAEFRSDPTWVAGNPLQLCMEVDALDPYKGDNGRAVGFYVMHDNHSNRHDSLFPIQIGGTVVLMDGNSTGGVGKQKVYSEEATLDEAGDGRGWETFSTLGGIRANFMRGGNVTIRATLRVKRRLVVREI